MTSPTDIVRTKTKNTNEATWSDSDDSKLSDKNVSKKFGDIERESFYTDIMKVEEKK